MNKRAVVISPEARDDIVALYDWIAGSASEARALEYVERVEAFILSLDLASERGHRRDDVRPGLRILGFERRLTLAIFVDAKHVTLLRLFRSGQDWERVFE